MGRKKGNKNKQIEKKPKVFVEKTTTTQINGDAIGLVFCFVAMFLMGVIGLVCIDYDSVNDLGDLEWTSNDAKKIVPAFLGALIAGGGVGAIWMCGSIVREKDVVQYLRSDDVEVINNDDY